MICKTIIKKAKYMLDTTSESLMKIADECGFESQAYFCYVFKKETGMTPRQYKNRTDSSYLL